MMTDGTIDVDEDVVVEDVVLLLVLVLIEVDVDSSVDCGYCSAKSSEDEDGLQRRFWQKMSCL